MSGPSPMALGPYAFEALGFSFHGQATDLQTPWAELNVTMRFDSLQWVGPKSDAFSIKGVVFDEAFGGQSSLDGLKTSAQFGMPLMLVTLNGNVHGLHVVFGINEDRSNIRFDGMAAKNSYEIQLRRYTPSGVVGGLLSLF